MSLRNLSVSTLTITVGNSQYISITGTDENSQTHDLNDNDKAKWIIDNPNLLELKDGKIYAKSQGTTNISVSFESESNANKLVADLRKKGYNALIADTNKYGMYRVAYDGMPSLNLAKEKLSAIRNEDNAEAWVLKK